MPYSQSLGLVHIAIPKTGTTSLVSALHSIQRARGGELGLLNDEITREFRAKHRLNILGDRRPSRAKHLSAIQLKYILGDEEFDRCFKFSVVRNPWARTVSRYFFKHLDFKPPRAIRKTKGTTRKFHNQDFETWMTKRWKHHVRRAKKDSQLRKLVDLDGRLLVDYVGRLETIQETLDHICTQLGVEQMTMPHVNGTRKGHYSQFYNQRTMGMVEEICRADIEYFGYRFEE